jgi:hypothetical protein
MNEKTEEPRKDLVVFLDTIGRTIIAKRVGETNSTISVENPAVVNILPQQVPDPNTGQMMQRMALQLFPLFFREFLAAKEEPVCFKYNKANITMSEGDIALDFKVGIQYEQLFASVGDVSVQSSPPPSQPPSPQATRVPPPATGPAPEKIQLFDD